MARKDCPECEGTGWKPVEIDGIRRVMRCSCNEAKLTERLLEQAAIPRRYEHCAFENFDIRKDRETGLANPSLSRAKLYAQGFVNEYPTDFGLLFVGTTGVGKTHLGVAILRELMIRKGVECLFQDFQELLKQIRDSYNPISQTTESRVLAPVLETEVLLLDELTAPNASDWVRDTLAYIVNSRYNQKRVTLITTTLPFGETGSRRDIRTPSGELIPSVERTLGDLGVTLRSRLYEMCKVIEMHSDDYRKAIKQAGYKFHVE
jgi:DNA replication protein DnaC